MISFAKILHFVQDDTVRPDDTKESSKRKNKARISTQDALALLGGMVSSRGRLVKAAEGGGRREYKGKTIRGIDRPECG